MIEVCVCLGEDGAESQRQSTPLLDAQAAAADANYAVPDALGLPPSVVGMYTGGATQTFGDFAPSAETTAQGPTAFSAESTGEWILSEAATTVVLRLPYIQLQMTLSFVGSIATIAERPRAREPGLGVCW